MKLISTPETNAVRSLAALAQVHRLRVFRALVTAGSDGMTPGAMAAHLAITPSALSFHLKELLHASLVSTEARGRNLIYRASFEQMTALLSYLTANCCQGAPCEMTTTHQENLL
jgi:ArsR family transcriptional regulator, arsenate/arsenite/antimonite-responsive transcriptional repressor